MTIPQPLPPDSIFHRNMGDWRGLLVGPGTGILQLMHPAIGAGVLQHSNFFNEPYGRVFRSLVPIMESKLGGPYALAAAERIRDYHLDIKGVDAHGERYHALDPETWLWAHATFVMADIAKVELYVRPLNRAERRQFWEDGKQWYRLYGVSDRVLPDTLEDFEAYWDHMCEDVLENTEAARWSVETFDDPSRARPPGFPAVAWAVVGRRVMAEQKLLTAAMLPQSVLDKLGMAFSDRDRRRFARRVRLLAGAQPLLNPLVIGGVRRLPYGTPHIAT